VEERELWRFAAAGADSLGLADFLALPEAQRRAREREASLWLERAERARRDVVRLRALATAVGLAPGLATVWLDLSREAACLGDLDRALGCLDAATAAVAHAPTGSRRDLHWRIALARAWYHRDLGQWQQARAWADTVLALAPRARRSLMTEGIVLACAGDLDGAGNVAREIERIDFFRFEWRWIRGLIELSRGNPRDAYHWLIQADPLPEDAARFHQDLGLACELLGNEHDARRFYGYAFAARDPDEALVRPPLEVVVPREEGEPLHLPVWISTGDRFLAGSLAGWAAAAAESCLAARGERRLYWSDRAIPLLSRAIRWRLWPHWLRALRGRVAWAVGAEEVALADLRREARWQLSEGRPDAPTLAAFGDLLNRRGWFGRAIAILRTATAADSSYAAAWSGLGYALLQAGRGEEGLQALDRALALDPLDVTAWFNRGLASYRQGRLDRAVADLERARQLAPRNPEVLRLLQKISRLRARRPAERPRR